MHNIRDILKFIGETYSGYVILLIGICSFVMIFIDRKKLKREGLKKEARYSLAMGLLHASIGIILYIVSVFAPIR